MSDKRTAVFYHDNCLDGFGAAYAAWTAFGDDALYLPMNHGELPPVDLDVDEIFVLDFCFPRETLLTLASQVERLVVLDHHKSALPTLDCIEKEAQNIRYILDIDRSGAGISWDYFSTARRPDLIDYIEDRDLWRWRYEETDAVTTALATIPREFVVWDNYATRGSWMDSLLTSGEAMVRYRDMLVADIVKTAWMHEENGFIVPVVNVPGSLTSEVLNVLAEGYPFAMGYTDREDTRKWSLRSSKTGLDVADIAASMGGGGHRHSAGFSHKK